MKKQIIRTALILSLLAPIAMNGQDVPPPPPPGHDSTGNQSGGRGGPVGGGLLILLVLSGTYGGYKLYRKKRRFKIH